MKNETAMPMNINKTVSMKMCHRIISTCNQKYLTVYMRCLNDTILINICQWI